MKNNLTPEMMAAYLYQTFQFDAVDITANQRKYYTIFAAIQHCNIISSPDLPKEDLIYWDEVIKFLEKRI
jgi:hypothetical protein